MKSIIISVVFFILYSITSNMDYNDQLLAHSYQTQE